MQPNPRLAWGGRSGVLARWRLGRPPVNAAARPAAPESLPPAHSPCASVSLRRKARRSSWGAEIGVEHPDIGLDAQAAASACAVRRDAHRFDRDAERRQLLRQELGVLGMGDDVEPACAARFGQSLPRQADDLVGRDGERRTQQALCQQASQRHRALERALVGFGFMTGERQRMRSSFAEASARASASARSFKSAARRSAAATSSSACPWLGQARARPQRWNPRGICRRPARTASRGETHPAGALALRSRLARGSEPGRGPSSPEPSAIERCRQPTELGGQGVRPLAPLGMAQAAQRVRRGWTQPEALQGRGQLFALARPKSSALPRTTFESQENVRRPSRNRSCGDAASLARFRRDGRRPSSREPQPCPECWYLPGP